MIEDHVLLAVYCKIDLSDLGRAKNRIWVPNLKIDWGVFDNAFRMSFRCLLDMFHTNRSLHQDRDVLAKILPLDQKIDFYFDNHSAKRPILAGWDDYIAGRPDGVKELYGATPRFEDDEDFLPLQAADFWAWWVRRAYQDDTLDKLKAGDFGSWKSGKAIPGMAISFTEDELTAGFIQLFAL